MDAARAPQGERLIRAPITLSVTEGHEVLDEPTAHYLVHVLRLKHGDKFVVFDPWKKIEVDAVLVDERTIDLSNVRSATVVAENELVLVYCLAKGDKVDDVVRDATELGASRVVVARAERSVVKADASRADAKKARWERIAEQAARQCGRGDLMTVEGVFDWEAALYRASTCDARFLLDPHAKQELGPLLQPSMRKGFSSFAFAIGPEGGLTPEEIASAESAGWIPVSLGPFVLRTETVAAAVLGAIRVLSAQGTFYDEDEP